MVKCVKQKIIRVIVIIVNFPTSSHKRKHLIKGMWGDAMGNHNFSETIKAFYEKGCIIRRSRARFTKQGKLA